MKLHSIVEGLRKHPHAVETSAAAATGLGGIALGFVTERYGSLPHNGIRDVIQIYSGTVAAIGSAIFINKVTE